MVFQIWDGKGKYIFLFTTAKSGFFYFILKTLRNTNEITNIHIYSRIKISTLSFTIFTEPLIYKGTQRTHPLDV